MPVPSQADEVKHMCSIFVSILVLGARLILLIEGVTEFTRGKHMQYFTAHVFI